MRTLSVCAIVFALLIAPLPASATGPTLNHCLFSWSEATVADNDLASFNIKLGGASGGPYTTVGTFAAPGPGGGSTYAPTTNYCAGQPDGQKYAVVTAVDTAGNESAPSTEVPFALNVTAPSVPTGLTVR